MIKRTVVYFLVIFISQFSACAIFPSVVNVVDQESLRKQLEELFRRQNNATSEVMMLTMDDPDAESFTDLFEAEAEMQQACEPLNEYAVRERDKLEAGLILIKKILDAMAACEESTEQVELILNEDFKN